MSLPSFNPHWKAWLQGKLVTPERAVDEIPSGSRIFIGSGAAAPTTLLKAMAVPGAGPEEAETVSIMTLGDAPHASDEFMDRYRHNALFIGGNVRNAVNDGRADYTPVHLHEVPSLFEPGANLPVDVALIQVSPPDHSGFVSLGVSVDVVRGGVKHARMILAEINPRMPRTHGDTFLHVDQIAFAVEADHPIPELDAGKPGDVEMSIGRYVAELIEDGATLQMGIGKIPDAVLAQLGDKKDLGVHTEMMSDGVVELMKAGIINNRRKTFHPGKAVCSFAMGKRPCYEFLDDNPMFEFHPSDYVNNPVNIARNNQMIAINSALQVDLTGQICSDSRGTSFYSGVGGQVDFIRGAAMAKGGKPIIALPSTAKGGQISRIAPTLSEGAGVVTTRADVHYVVTEWGIAYLHGRTVRERAMELMSIAHPDHREQLYETVKERKFFFREQPKYTLLADYPAELRKHATLRNDERVRVRPLRAADEPHVREMFRRCSEETVDMRFEDVTRAVVKSDVREWLDLDYKDRHAIVVRVGKPGEGDMVGIAQYDKDPETGMAAIAFLVEDRWQGKGVGSLLLKELTAAAEANGIKGFTACVRSQNSGMLQLLHHCGYPLVTRYEGGRYHVTIEFEERN